MPLAAAADELRRSAGTQLDPKVVDAFERVLSSRTEEYARARANDFSAQTTTLAAAA